MSEKRNDSLLDTLREGLHYLVFHNLGLKIIALIISVAIWAGLITQDSSLTREKVFQNVTVNITGSDTLKRNGYIVTSDLSSLVTGFTIRANVPQLQYENVAVTSYNPRLELSRINKAGEQQLKVTTTTTTTSGSVFQIDPPTVTVDVEEYVTRFRIPVSIAATGTLPEGLWTSSTSIDPPLLSISGPKSLVQSVVRAEAALDLDGMPDHEGTVRTAAPLRLLDREGHVIESDLLEVTSESVLIDSVVIEQELYSIKELPIDTRLMVTGQPAEGYEIKNITISPTRIMAAGKSLVLEALESVVPEGKINVNDQTDTLRANLRLRRPSELNYMSTDNITVTVEIGLIDPEAALGSEAGTEEQEP